MGTNYYLYKKPLVSRVLEKLGKDGQCEKIRRWLWKYKISSGHYMHGEHIGKSSAGWTFALHVAGKYDDPIFDVNGLEDWSYWFLRDDFYVADEYGRVVSPSNIMGIICRRSWRNEYADRERELLGEVEYFRQRGGVPGPDGLARSRIDGHHCIGHGPGAYDYITGDFS